jgi:hypothetical protein
VGNGGLRLLTTTEEACLKKSDTPLSLILALVAGIQRPDVCRVKDSLQLKDLS